MFVMWIASAVVRNAGRLGRLRHVVSGRVERCDPMSTTAGIKLGVLAGTAAAPLVRADPERMVRDAHERRGPLPVELV